MPDKTPKSGGRREALGAGKEQPRSEAERRQRVLQPLLELRRLDLLELDAVAANPGRGLGQCLRHRLGRGRLVEGELARDERAAAPGRVNPAHELPARQREVVLLRDVEGMSSDEVCTVLALSEGNQRVLLHRGRSRLRQLVEDEFREVR